MVEWVIEPFGSHHLRDTFTCGKPSLDDFLRARVTQYEKRRLGKTFVGVLTSEPKVIGYYTLAASSVLFANLPIVSAKKLPKHPVPVILLARLAVDQSMHGNGVGEGLLLDALQRSLTLSANLGVYAVEVDAIDESSAAFYARYGFTPLLDTPLHLYLPLSTIKDTLSS